MCSMRLVCEFQDVAAVAKARPLYTRCCITKSIIAITPAAPAKKQVSRKAARQYGSESCFTFARSLQLGFKPLLICVMCYLVQFDQPLPAQDSNFPIYTWHHMLGYFMTLPFPLYTRFPDVFPFPLPIGSIGQSLSLEWWHASCFLRLPSLERCRLWQNIADLSPRQSLPKKKYRIIKDMAKQVK